MLIAALLYPGKIFLPFVISARVAMFLINWKLKF